MIKDREAEKRAGVKLWSRNFIIIALSNLVVLCGGNMLVTTFPFYVVKLGGDNVTVGIAAAVFSVCAFISRPAAGWILDNKTRRTVLFVCMTAVMIICPLYLVLPYIGCLIVLRALHGVFWASTGSGLNTNVTDILPKLRFGEGMAWFGLTNSMAMIIGPATGLMIWEKWGAVPVFLIVSITTLITMLLLTRFDFKPIPRREFKIEGSPVKWALNLFDRRALPAAALMSAVCLPGGAISSFIALYAAQIGIASGGVYFTFQASGALMTRLFSGKVLDRYGEAPMIYAACACFLLGLNTAMLARTSFVFYLGAFLYGIGYGLSIPAFQTMSLRNVPENRRGAASATYLCSWDVSFGLGGFIGGVLSKLVGYVSMFRIMCAGIILCLVLYIFWVRNTPAAYRVWHSMERAES